MSSAFLTGEGRGEGRGGREGGKGGGKGGGEGRGEGSPLTSSGYPVLPYYRDLLPVGGLTPPNSGTHLALVPVRRWGWIGGISLS